jgi:hypothetical protein
MTLEEAANAVGRGVVYRPAGAYRSEDGVITSVNDRWVFVRYGVQDGSKATDPADLTLLATEATSHG